MVDKPRSLRLRLIVRTMALIVCSGFGLLVVHYCWFTSRGVIGVVMDWSGAAGRISLFLLVGALFGALDRWWQGEGHLWMYGAFSGFVSWLLGGTILYSVQSLSEIPYIPLEWHAHVPGHLWVSRFAFSGMAVVAGLSMGLVLGLLQTLTPTGRRLQQNGWPVWSMIAGGLGWALIPLGTLSS